MTIEPSERCTLVFWPGGLYLVTIITSSTGEGTGGSVLSRDSQASPANTMLQAATFTQTGKVLVVRTTGFKATGLGYSRVAALIFCHSASESMASFGRCLAFSVHSWSISVAR